VLELLASYGANLNAGDGEGYTCVHSAAQSGKAEMLRVLRRLGARPDAATVRGAMPIHVAAEGGRAEVVEELLDWCPELLEAEDNRGHRQGLTLVHFSAQLKRFLWDRGRAEGLCSPR